MYFKKIYEVHHLAKSTATEKRISHYKILLEQLQKANEKKDENKFKRIIKEVEEILGEPILNVLVDKDGSDEQVQFAIDIVNYLLLCIKDNKTYYFYLLDENLRDLSKDIAIVYSKFILYTEFELIRRSYAFAEPTKSIVKLFEQREYDMGETLLEDIEYSIGELILNKCMSTFENQIESCSNMIIDLSLLEKIRRTGEIPMQWIDGYLYMLNNESEKKRLADTSVFAGNPLLKRDKEKYNLYKKIATIKSIGEKYYPNIRVTEVSICEYFNLDSKSFNSWKNRNIGEYDAIIENLTIEEIKLAKKEINKIYISN